MSDKVYIFSNGAQFTDWQLSNCERCKKSSVNDPDDDGTNWPLRCEIESALVYAAMDDGKVTPEIRERSGYKDGYYNWQCSEVEWTEEWKAEVLARRENDKEAE